MKDSRILKLRKGEFRSKLAIEDVKLEGVDIFELQNPHGRTEKVVSCIENPIKIPYINYFGSKITHKDDPYLMSLVFDLMYLNKGIDPLGVKKMIEFIIRRAVKWIGNKPMLKFEDIEETVKSYVRMSEKMSYEPLSDVIVLFERSTMLTPEERRSISLQCRSERNSNLHGALIHNAAITAIDLTKEQLIITRPRVLQQVTKNKIKTIRTLNKHMRNDTIKLLEKANVGRLFNSEKSMEKFEKFLALPIGTTSREAAEQLGVSLSTITEFKNIIE